MSGIEFYLPRYRVCHFLDTFIYAHYVHLMLFMSLYQVLDMKSLIKKLILIITGLISSLEFDSFLFQTTLLKGTGLE